MAFRNVRDVLAAWEAGRCWNSFVHKSSCPTPGATRWADMSMGAGTPIYNAYVGAQYEATPLVGTKNQGINTGPAPQAGKAKYLAQMAMASTQGTNGPPYTVQVCDYLMFYPLVDGDSTDQQDLVNDATLPRYTDGVGVQAMLVCSTPTAANGTVLVNVTTADNVDVTLSVTVYTASATGQIFNSAGSTTATASNPFIPLAEHRGIKRVNWVTNTSGLGGFYNVVLVKPITSMMVREVNTMTEHCLVSQKLSLPRIYDGAYINFLIGAQNTGNPAVLRGQFDFIWE